MNVNAISKQTVEKIQSLISENQVFTITTHANADGDALGSSTAFAEVLRQMGKMVNIILPNDCPSFFKWVNGFSEILVYTKNPSKCTDIINKTDVFICLDYNQLSRIEEVGVLLSKKTTPRIVIDHHLGLDIPADAVVSVPESGATCELLYYVLKNCGFEDYININVAESLYLGLITDTGCFSYASSYPEIYEVAGALIKRGIRKAYIHDCIYNVYTYNRMKLLGVLLKDNFVYLPVYHAVYMFISLQDQKNYGFSLGDTEGFVNYPLMLTDVKFCALFTEYEHKTIKVSLRSKGNFPANKFAADYFNGGGHFNAAGGKIHVTLAEAIKIFTEGVKQQEYNDILNLN